MPQVKITYNGTSLFVFADLDDPLEIFRIQVLSMFEVDISEQRFSITALHTSPETTSLRQIGWTETGTYEITLKKEEKPRLPTQSEQQFLARLKSSYAHVKSYSDASLRNFARENIPVTELEAKARKTTETLPEVSFRDALLLELLHWFKKDFFKWVNKPDCGVCQGKEATMNALGATMPSPEERMCQAGVTEIFGCTLCGAQTRFPRYNDPRKLLTWRQGRCGEWANCFTLCCFALGFEARHVVDWTDHVWTEVFSESQQRWLHCDSCEDKCDIPLLYEAGWGKKLSYVIAFSETHITDVSKRYTRKWDELVTRRTLIPEQLLAAHIDTFNQLIAASLPPHLIPTLIERHAKEAEELATPPQENAQGLEGRISGSHAWKVARGETGPSS